MYCIVIDAHLSDGNQLVMHDVFPLREIEVSTRIHLFPPTPPHFSSHTLLVPSPELLQRKHALIEQAVTLRYFSMCMCVCVVVCVLVCVRVCVYVCV